MTVSSNTTKNLYTGNAVTTSFAYQFKILSDTEILVQLNGVTQSSGFTVSGVGNNSGGSVVFSSAPGNGVSVALLPNPAFSQEIDYNELDAFPAEAHETGLDRAAIRDLSLKEQIDRSIKLPSDVSGVTAELPDPTANTVLGWNSAATALENKTLSSFPNTISIVTVGLANGDFLKYDGTNFVNRTPAQVRTDLILGALATLNTVAAAQIDSNAVTTAKILDKNVTAAKLASGAVLQAVRGRLTSTSGTPVTTGDVTAVTTVYFTPYLGNKLPLYDGADWRLYTFTERTLSLSGLTANTNYDIFIYDNAGTLTLEAVAWTNNTTRATALVSQDGVLVKSGQTSRLYVGTIRITNTTGQTEDSTTKRYIWNAYNRVARSMFRNDSTDSWTYSTNSFRQANANAANQLDFVRGLDEDAVDASVVAVAFSSAATYRSIVPAIGLDSTTAAAATCLFPSFGVNNSTSVAASAHYRGLPGIGYHYLAWLERGGGADTQTWFGDNSAGTACQCGISGTVWA